VLAAGILPFVEQQSGLVSGSMILSSLMGRHCGPSALEVLTFISAETWGHTVLHCFIVSGVASCQKGGPGYPPPLFWR
jgi:hypothetical protein